MHKMIRVKLPHILYRLEVIAVVLAIAFVVTGTIYRILEGGALLVTRPPGGPYSILEATLSEALLLVGGFAPAIRLLRRTPKRPIEGMSFAVARGMSINTGRAR